MKRLITILLFLCSGAAAQYRPAPMTDPGGGNLPVQRIGANDLIALSVYDAPELSRTVRVAPDGTVRLPMLQQHIQAAGLMPAELEAAIAGALRGEALLVDPFVTVTVAEYTSRPISVMGAVKKPLTFQAASPVTLLEALARAEGLAQDAGPEILLSRTTEGKPLLRRIAVRQLIDGADPEYNILLRGGEEIRVPEAGRVFVVGNVKKPGAFVLNENEGTSLLKALAMAEGLMPFAGKQAYIYRREAAGTAKNEIPVELKQILQRKSADVPLVAGDILYVPDNQGRRTSLAVLEKMLMFGGGATSALIYAGVR